MKDFKFGIGDVVALKSNPHFPMTVYVNKVGKDDFGSEEKVVYVTWVKGDGGIEMHGFIEECLVCVVEWKSMVEERDFMQKKIDELGVNLEKAYRKNNEHSDKIRSLEEKIRSSNRMHADELRKRNDEIDEYRETIGFPHPNRNLIGNLRNQLEVAERRLAEFDTYKEHREEMSRQLNELERKIKMYEAGAAAQQNSKQPK